MILQYFSLRAVKKGAMSAINREASMQIVKKMMRNILPFSMALLYYNSAIDVGLFWGESLISDASAAPWPYIASSTWSQTFRCTTARRDDTRTSDAMSSGWNS